MVFPFLEIAALVLPKLISLITDDKTIANAEQIKAATNDAVKAVTGAQTPSQAQAAIQDPAIADRLKVRLAEIAQEARRIDAEADADYNREANADTVSARNTLLELLNRPESRWVTITPSIISYIVVLGFFALVAMLMFGGVILPKGDDRVTQIIFICVGAISAGFATVLNFWLGSSLGSRRKDSAVALSGAVDNLKELSKPPTPAGPTGPAPTDPTRPSAGGQTGSGGGDAKGSGDPTTGTDVQPLPPSLAGVGRSTDSSTVNRTKDIPPGGDVPASFRYNNPGAQYPSREAAKFGQLGFGIIGGGNKIAAFPSGVNGAAANFELLYRVYTGLSIGAAGQKWTGQHGFGVPGYDPNIVLSREMIADREQAVALLQAIAKRESGRGTNLTDEQWKFAHDMFSAGSADAFLKQFGVAIQSSVTTVRPDGPPDDLLENLIVKALGAKGYAVDKGPGEVNIVYIEGINEDGSPNNDEANKFNDLRCVVSFKNNEPIMINKWKATTEPGYYYDRDHPINAKGAARIKFGQYRAWQVGIHRGTQEALVQVGPVTVCRDLNRDMERTGDLEDTGSGFGINQHGGYDLPVDDVGKASAGCLVGRTMAGHRQFMDVVKSDPRFVADPKFVFAAAILPAGALAG